MRTVADEWWRPMERLLFDLDSEALPTRSEMSLLMKEGPKTTADEAMMGSMPMERKLMKVSS